MNKLPPHHDYCESNLKKAVFIETKVGKGRNKAAILYLVHRAVPHKGLVRGVSFTRYDTIRTAIQQRNCQIQQSYVARPPTHANYSVSSQLPVRVCKFPRDTAPGSASRPPAQSSASPRPNLTAVSIE
jgi:hypothetical protein